MPGSKAGAVALVVLGPGLFSGALKAQDGPCLEATENCTEWIKLDDSSRSLVHRTYPLKIKSEKITRALVMVHGAGRDADNYFRTALAAGFLGPALEDTIIIAPRYASNNDRGCKDKLAENEVNWSCNGDSWRSGGTATSDKKLTSYYLIDEILRELASKSVFPNLKVIVVAGHSAGGQFTTRYEMANTVHEKLGVPVRYVVANPSSYAYLDATRPATDGTFKPYAAAPSCPEYDTWPYGLKDRSGYTAKLSDEQLVSQLKARPVTYLVGEIDILPLGGFDSSCPAMAQGPTRRARGQAYQKYIAEIYQTTQKIEEVHLCGHNARCMFTADNGVSLLFPKQ